MCIIYKMSHGNKRVVKGFSWCNAPLLVQGKHTLQQVDELSSVHFFSHQFAPLQISWYVYLQTKNNGSNKLLGVFSYFLNVLGKNVKMSQTIRIGLCWCHVRRLYVALLITVITLNLCIWCKYTCNQKLHDLGFYLYGNFFFLVFL